MIFKKLINKDLRIMSGWTLDIKNMSWVEHTKEEVDFIVKALNLKGCERILDLACGYGRHSLELARRGYDVVGIDITEIYIHDAIKNAKKEKLDIQFVCKNILDVRYNQEFDVVINMADGAIGYFETEEDNLKIFDIISSSLKSSGKHLMGICSGDFGKKHFPRRNWQAGSKSLSLADFKWDKTGKRMIYKSHVLKFNEILEPIKDTFEKGNDSGIRLYTLDELNKILNKRNMKIIAAYGDYNTSTAASEDQFMQVICSEKI